MVNLLDCATDYSGFGGSLQNEAEMFIKMFLEEDLIERQQILVDKNTFTEYLLSRDISHIYDEDAYSEVFSMNSEASSNRNNIQREISIHNASYERSKFIVQSEKLKKTDS